VKLAPLVRELRHQPHIHTDVINSGQHGNAPPKLLEELQFLNSYQRVSLGGRLFVEF
jgi:UDP-N-acetylglucosamine 2-epimerase